MARVEGFKKQRAVPRLGKKSVGEAVLARASGSAAARRKAGKENQITQLSLSQPELTQAAEGASLSSAAVPVLPAARAALTPLAVHSQPAQSALAPSAVPLSWEALLPQVPWPG